MIDKETLFFFFLKKYNMSISFNQYNNLYANLRKNIYDKQWERIYNELAEYSEHPESLLTIQYHQIKFPGSVCLKDRESMLMKIKKLGFRLYYIGPSDINKKILNPKITKLTNTQKYYAELHD